MQAQDTPADMLEFVRAASRLAGLPLDEAAMRRVAQHLSRTAAMAQILEGETMAVEVEPAEVFCPAPYPRAGSAEASS